MKTASKSNENRAELPRITDGEWTIMKVVWAHKTTTAKQVVDAIKGGNGMFRQVVLVEFPRKGIYAIGFLTNENKGRHELSEKTGKNLISIFMPFAPPTSGYIVFVPKEDCIFLEMSVSDGMKLVISGGVAAPEYPYIKHKTENSNKP